MSVKERPARSYPVYFWFPIGGVEIQTDLDQPLEANALEDIESLTRQMLYKFNGKWVVNADLDKARIYVWPKASWPSAPIHQQAMVPDELFSVEPSPEPDQT